MIYLVEEELISICKDIIKENKDLDEWRQIESCDMFQTESLSGGFDSIEMQFCFSLYREDDEYWFQLTLNDITKIVSGEIKQLDLIEAID